MGKIVFDQELLGVMRILSNLSRARVKDCFLEGDTYFIIVEKGDVGLMIGKGGMIIKKVKERLRKNVKVIEYNENPVKFVRSLIYPTRVEDISLDDEQVLIKGGDRRINGLIFGRGGENLRWINKVVKRFFDVEVKVV
tara:strand:- start:129 stop:542 length:414 start_codon:yes stop_codon:yes gene_type:complete